MKLLLKFVVILIVYFASAEGQKHNCTLCVNGPRKSNGVAPVANGCGPAALGGITGPLVSQSADACCNTHDLCYGDCTTDKVQCDADFRKCLKEATMTTLMGFIPVENLFPKIVEVMGCSSYITAQVESCICSNANDTREVGDWSQFGEDNYDDGHSFWE